MRKINLKNKRGFTLIEIIIAIGLFGIAVSISIGSLVNLYNAHNKSQAIASVMNNLNFSIENMTRTIRFATIYHCGTGTPIGPYNTPQPCNTINGGDWLAVSTSSTAIFNYNSSTQKIEVSYNNGPFIEITSDEVKIQNMKFFVVNTTPGDTAQPYVLVSIKGYAGAKPSEQSYFDLQTVISQRELDL